MFWPPLVLLALLFAGHSSQQQQPQQQQQLVNVTLSLLALTSATSGGAILSQRLLDHRGAPLLLVADDLLLPSAALSGVVDCRALQLSFVTSRMRSDADPSNVTVQLLRATDAGPGTLFFQRTWSWSPGAPLGTAVTALTLRNGDWDDAAQVQFQLQNASFWPPDSPIWVALYVTMPVDPAPTSQNAFFWLTLAAGTAAQLASPSSFYYRDASNAQHWGFINWTNASTATRRLSLSAGTTQMQWSAALQCQQLQTEAPATASPTTTEAPIVLNETNASDTNASLVAPRASPSVAVAVSVPIALIVAIALSALLVHRIRRRRALASQREKAKQQVAPLVNIREQMLEPEPHTISFETQPRANNPLWSAPLAETRHRVFTSGSEMIEVPLRNPQGPYAALLNDAIVTTSDGEQ